MASPQFPTISSLAKKPAQKPKRETIRSKTQQRSAKAAAPISAAAPPVRLDALPPDQQVIAAAKLIETDELEELTPEVMAALETNAERHARLVREHFESLTPEAQEEVRRLRTRQAAIELGAQDPQQLERIENLKLFLAPFTDSAGNVDIREALAADAVDKSLFIQAGISSEVLTRGIDTSRQAKAQQETLAKIAKYRKGDNTYDVAGALRDGVVGQSELVEAGFDVAAIGQALDATEPVETAAVDRQRIALDELQRQNLIQEVEPGVFEADPEAIVRARAEGLATEAGFGADALDTTRDVIQQSQAEADLQSEQDRVSGLEERRQTELGGGQNDRREEALSTIEGSGFLSNIDSQTGALSVNVAEAADAGLEDELVAIGFSVKDIQDAIAEYKQNQIAAALGAVDQFQKDRAIYEAALESGDLTGDIGLPPEQAEAIRLLDRRGHLSPEGVNVVAAALDSSISPEQLAEVGISPAAVSAVKELQAKRLVTPDQELNAVLAYGLALNNQEGLTEVQMDNLMRQIGVSDQEISNAKRLSQDELPEDLDNPGFAIPIRSYPPSSQIIEAPSADVESPGAIRDKDGNIIGYLDFGQSTSGVSVGAIPRVPVFRGVSGRVGLAIGAAALLATVAEAIHKGDLTLPSIQRERVDRDLLSPPGLAVRVPPALAEIAPQNPKIPVSPPEGMTPGQLPQLGKVAVPSVDRVLASATAVVEAANNLDVGIERGGGLTEAEKSGLRGLAERITAADRTVAVPIDQLLDNILVDAPPQIKSGYARQLAELQAKQRVLNDAKSALVESQGFSPNTTSITPRVIATATTQAITAAQTGTTQQPATTTQTQPVTVTRTSDLSETGVSQQTTPQTLTQTQTRTLTDPTTRTRSQPLDRLQTRLGDITQTQPGVNVAPTTITETQPVPLAQTATQTSPATNIRTQTRTATTPRPQVRVSVPSILARIPRVATTIPPRLPSLEEEEEPESGMGSRFNRVVTHQQGVTQVTTDLDTGARGYQYDPQESRQRPSETFRVVTRDDDPPPGKVYRMGFMDVMYTEAGPIYIPNELANRGGKPRSRGLRSPKL